MNVNSSSSNRHFLRIRIFSFCLLLLPGLTGAVSAEDKKLLSPYIESFPEGKIDWENGTIYGVGKGYLNQNQNSKNRSLRAAQLIAQKSLLKVAARIRLNDRQTLESLEQETGGLHLKAFVRSGEDHVAFASGSDQPHFIVTAKAPIKGIEGLTINLLNHMKNTPGRWQSFPRPSATDPSEDQRSPWLILDARRLMAGNALKPALFPKIISTSGQTIYDLKTVDEKALIKSGMAGYAASDMTPAQLHSQKKRWGNLLAEVLQMLFARPAFAGEDKKKRKRRKYIVTEVQKAQGLMKTNLIISENDARKITAEDGSSRILKKCRVIILISSPVGGIEGSIPHYLALTL